MCLLTLSLLRIGYDFSGFDSQLTSNLDKISRFKGREFWVLCQIIPLLLRNMKNQRSTHFWMLLSEICGFYYLRQQKREGIDERFDRVEEIFVVLIKYLTKLGRMLKTHLLGKHARRDVKLFGNLIDLNAEFFEFTNLRGKITYERGNKVSQNKMLPLEEARIQTCNFLKQGGVWFQDDSLVTLGSDFIQLFEKKPEPKFNFFVGSAPLIKEVQIKALLQTLGEQIEPHKQIKYFAKVSIHGSKCRSNFISYGSQGSFARVRGGIKYGEKEYLLLSPLHFTEIDSISLCDRYKLDLDSYLIISTASRVETVNFVHDCAIHGCQNLNSSSCTKGYFLLNRFHHKTLNLRLLDMERQDFEKYLKSEPPIQLRCLIPENQRDRLYKESSSEAESSELSGIESESEGFIEQLRQDAAWGTNEETDRPTDQRRTRQTRLANRIDQKTKKGDVNDEEEEGEEEDDDDEDYEGGAEDTPSDSSNSDSD